MPILPLASFEGGLVDHIVSLGSACETAYNLRRHFGFATAYPFDWWISQTAGVARFIREADAAALYRESELQPSANARSIVNARYGIRLHHEFPRDRQVRGQPVIAGWARHLAAPQARTAHLIRRLSGLAAAGQRIVFVRSFGPRDTNAAAALSLLAALEDRFAPARIGVVLVNHEGRLPAGPPVHRLAVARVAGSDWRGDAGAWDAALGTLGLRLTPGLHRPAAPDDLSAHVAATSLPEDAEAGQG